MLPSRAQVERGSFSVSGENQAGTNLAAANLSGRNLGGMNLGGANLGGANLGGANLGGREPRWREPRWREPRWHQPGRYEPGRHEPRGHEPGWGQPRGHEPRRHEPRRNESRRLDPFGLRRGREPGRQQPHRHQPQRHQPGRPQHRLQHPRPRRQHERDALQRRGRLGHRPERCVVMGIGSTAFAKLLGQQSANATMYVALGKLPWGFATTSGAPARSRPGRPSSGATTPTARSSWSLRPMPPGRASPASSRPSSAGRRPPRQTMHISGIEASAPHDSDPQHIDLYSYTGHDERRRPVAAGHGHRQELRGRRGGLRHAPPPTTSR